MRKKIILLLLLAFSAGLAQAALRAYEPFEGTAGVNLDGLGTGTGWSDNWTRTSGLFQYQEPSNSFGDLEVAGQKALFLGSGGAYAEYVRPLDTSVTVDASNTELWVSALIEIGSGTGDINAGRSIGIELMNGSTPVAAFGKRVNSSFGVGSEMGVDWVNSSVGGDFVGVRFCVLKLAFDGTDTVATAYFATGDETALDLSDVSTFAGSATVTLTGSVTVTGVNLWAYHSGTTSNTIDEIRVADAYSEFFVTDIASTPDPGNGEDLVPLNQQLGWLAPTDTLYIPSGYDVWFGTEPNAANPGYDMVKIEDKDTDLTANPGTLVNSTTYYWYVDAYEPNAPGPDIIHPGDLWSFTTEPPSVYFNEGSGPVSLTVEESAVPGVDPAEFTVDASNVDTYQWYKDDDATPDEGDETTVGTNSPTLTIDPVSQGDEGWYYCVITNNLPPENGGREVSASAQLMTKRLVGYWPFDGTLTETESGLTATVVDANMVDANPPVYGYGADANAIVGTGSLALDNSDDPNYLIGGWLQIDDSADLFNFYPQGLTISTWVKTPAGQSGEYNEIVSKNEGTTATRFFHRVAGSNGLFRIGSGGASTGESISDGAWHLMVSTYDPGTGTAQVYLDGTARGSFTPSPQTNSAPLTIGGSSSEGPQFGWIGWIDDVKIYSYAQTPEEIAQEYFDVTGIRSCIHAFGSTEVELDLNDDCVIDLADFMKFAEFWLDSGLYPAP